MIENYKNGSCSGLHTAIASPIYVVEIKYTNGVSSRNLTSFFAIIKVQTSTEHGSRRAEPYLLDKTAVHSEVKSPIMNLVLK